MSTVLVQLRRLKRSVLRVLFLNLYALRLPIISDLIIRVCKRLDGGEYYSTVLREIFKKSYGIDVGLYSYGGCFNYRNIRSAISVGRYGSFSTFHVFPRNHPMNFLCMHPFFYRTHLGFIEKDPVPFNRLTIGHGVWIGFNAIILPGVSKIGDGAVIGAGAVVTKDVPPYAIVVGNPGVIVRYRFPKKIIDKLSESRWWEKDIAELTEYMDLFTHPVELERIEEQLMSIAKKS